jgi:hypothetical protein
MEKSICDIISHNITVESKFGKTQIFKLEGVLKDYVEFTEDLEDSSRRNIQFDLEVEFRKRFLKDLIATYW